MASSFSFYCTHCGAANEGQAAFCFACGHALEAHRTLAANNVPAGTLSPGNLLKERYHIVGQLGKGGMGAVYKAEDTLFHNQLVAVKEMSQAGLNLQETLEVTDAFKREAHLLAGLNHPSLPRIHDYFSEAGRWYLVMDFIAGETLEDHLAKAKGGYLPVKKALAIGIQLCTVLDYLHTRQPPIIFRDLKPGNVMCIPDGQLYLIDFGIARHFKPGQSKDTASFGSAGYAPPEQYGKAQTTPRSDIYSLGATLHQLLSGDDPSQNPFQFAPLRLHSQPAPVGLESLIMQMLEMNADKRPASMMEVRRELQRLAAEQVDLEKKAEQAAIPPPPAPPPVPAAPKGASTAQPATPKQYALASPIVRTAPRVIYHGHAGPVTAVSWAPGGALVVSASDDSKVNVWQAEDGSLVYCNRGHSYGVTAVAWSPNGTYIASGGFEGRMQVFYAKDGRHVYTYRGPYIITALTWSPDSRCLAFSDDHGRLQVRDATDGGHAYTYSGHAASVTSVVWSPNGLHIASASVEGSVHVWDPARGSEGRVYSNSGHNNAVSALAWSPDSTRIASAGAGKSVQTWDSEDGRHIAYYSGHGDAITAVAWSPDGTRIASASIDKTVRIWEVATQNCTFVYSGHSDKVLALAWSPDGTRIASTSEDRTAHVIDLGVDRQ